MNEIFEKNNEASVDTIEFMKMIIIDVSAAVFKAACNLQGKNAVDVSKELMSLQQCDAKTIKRRLFEIVDEICKNADKTEMASRNEIINEIKGIIDLEYRSIELNVSYIADKMKMNANYISRVFSEGCGEGLLNYITKYRIEKSKELLRSSDMPLENIARMVGFASTNTYIRVFKKNEQITPGQYRLMD